MKREREKKRRQHEEELFNLDLQRAYDAEFNKEEIEERKMKDVREVETSIKEYQDK